jgi:HD-GYP domain-containing protein (c-di-GMP phosphodiesterase class II)
MNSPTALICAHCGTLIGNRPYARHRDRCCCEACFLEAREAYARQKDSYLAFAEALASALDLRERETGLHAKRVACHTLVLARRFVSDPAVLQQIYWGALLHDLGKIGIPDAILLKPGPLTPSEWAEMRTHPEKGHAIVSHLPMFDQAAEIILCHEERYDGSGYPCGLSGEAIPLGARLFAVIDALDAMTSDRPYRKGGTYDDAKAEILRLSGSQFDPRAVEALLAEEKVLREMVALKCHTPPDIQEEP